MLDLYGGHYRCPDPPMLEKLAEQYTNVNFLKCDVDVVKEIAQEYQVSPVISKEILISALISWRLQRLSRISRSMDIYRLAHEDLIHLITRAKPQHLITQYGVNRQCNQTM
jgi:thiol-disulfide isomerase/thioredoxin